MTDGDVAIRLTDVGKRFTKHDDTPTLIGQATQILRRTRRSQLWAIRHVDLQVARGKTLGVIGKNGSGKTTLLTMLAGVTSPTEGRVEVRGRVAPLIAVGVGFHPELTGRENVYVNGSILGLTTAEINRRFEGIVAFAEIPDFIDTPVKFYSSGMFVRLGFAVAVAAEPDVLLVDEVLAVGDLAFQMKCFERMQELQARGTTIVAVTHNLNAVRLLCDDVLVVHQGTPRYQGPVVEGLSLYHELLAEAPTDSGLPGDLAEIVRFELLSEDGVPTAHFNAGQRLTLDIEISTRAVLPDAVISIAFNSESGVLVYTDGTTGDGSRPFRIEAGANVRCRVEMNVALPTGSYSVQAVCRWGSPTPDAPRVLSHPRLFYVAGRHMVNGVADLGATFSVETHPAGGYPSKPSG